MNVIRVHIAAGISGLVAVGAAVLVLFVLRGIPASTHMEEQPDQDGEGARLLTGENIALGSSGRIRPEREEKSNGC